MKLWAALLAVSLAGCATPNRGTVRSTNQRAGNYTVNWGKSFPGGRGQVEYVNIKLPKPTDITLYLGQPSQQASWFTPNFVVSVGSGGTTFDYLVGTDIYAVVSGVASSCRGVALHFVADELYVRGDTSLPGVPLSAAELAALRFSAQAGLGRPSSFERMHPEERVANGDAEVVFALTPWSTHARVLVSWDPVTENVITGFSVRQENVSPFGTSIVMAEMPLEVYQAAGGVPLHPNATQIVVTTTGGGGPPPAGPPAGATYQIYLAETLVY